MALGYLDDGKLTAIADSIRSKTGKSATMTVDEMPDEIESIETGSGGGGRDPFNDGKSHIVIKIPNDDYGQFHLHLMHSVANSLTIDWGDGYSEAFPYGGSPYYEHYHEYADAGEYDIAIYGASGYTTFGGSYRDTVLGTYSSSNSDYRQKTTVEYVEIAGNDVIGDYAFTNCDSLGQLHVCDGVASIGVNAFSSCITLVSARIPQGCVLGSSAFYNCRLLRDFDAPDKITASSATFGSCYALESLPSIVPSSNSNVTFCQNDTCIRTVDVDAGGADITLGQNAFNGCTLLEDVTFNAVITSAGNNAFSMCERLVNVDSIIEHCTSIGQNAFNACRSLEYVTVPASVTTINNSVFSGCSSICTIAILGDVTSIGQSAFANCINLRSITFKSANPPTLANVNAFQSTNDCPIYVPAESVEAYKTASVWSNLASRIFADPSD